jgi:hypothetical protein
MNPGLHRLRYHVPPPAGLIPPTGLAMCLPSGRGDEELAAAIVAEPEDPADRDVWIFAICGAPGLSCGSGARRWTRRRNRPRRLYG